MKFSIGLINILLLIFISCGDNANTPKESQKEGNDSTEQRISTQTIEQLDYTEYALSSEAETSLNAWEKYQEIATQINYLKKGDLSFFTSEGESLNDFFVQLKTTIPPIIKTNAIDSRLVILETKAFKLKDRLTLENIETPIQLSSIKEVLVAFSNLNLQINKKLEFDEYNKIQPE